MDPVARYHVPAYYSPPLQSQETTPTTRLSATWITVIVLCVLLGIALILVVVLGATGVIFNKECTVNRTDTERVTDSTEKHIPSDTENYSRYPENSIEHVILKVPVYDPITVSRNEEQNLSREKPVIDHLNKESVFESRERPQLSILVPEQQQQQSLTSENADITDVLVPQDTGMAEIIDPAYTVDTPYTYADNDYSMQSSNGLHRFIEYVVYINLDENQTKRSEVEHEIDKLNLPEYIPRERLSAVKRTNTELGSFLSKIACLTKALSLKKNALILEDDFRLDQKPAEVLEALLLVEERFGNRWDVISFAQNVNEWQKVCDKGDIRVMRVLHSLGGTGMLVNKLYVPRLLAYWIQRMRTVLQKEQLQEARQIAKIKTDLQSWDMWLTFFYPIGHKVDDQWNYMDDMEHATNALGVCQTITLMPALERKRVAVCHLATGKYNQFVTAIQNDCYLKFLKMHHIEFFLFTDQASNYPEVTEEGAKLHTYSVTAHNYPHDNLYRFHYLLQAEEALKEFDYVYYMDVDYRLYQHPAEKQLMVNGVVATAHLHNIVEKRDGSKRHIGSPEVREESTACIKPEENMSIYYASSFHGGASVPYLDMCHTLKDNIDMDETRGITAKWLDESHLNRYLLDHPPVTILSQSYIFSERCLDIECRDPMCNALRESRIQPIMGTQI